MLLLNKFNIVPWHCLVVTSQFRSQLDDLDAADWAATWAILQVCHLAGGSVQAAGQPMHAARPLPASTHAFAMRRNRGVRWREPTRALPASLPGAPRRACRGAAWPFTTAAPPLVRGALWLSAEEKHLTA